MGNRTEFRIPTYTGEITLAVNVDEEYYMDEIRQGYVGASRIPAELTILYIESALYRVHHDFDRQLGDDDWFDNIPDFFEQINVLIYAGFENGNLTAAESQIYTSSLIEARNKLNNTSGMPEEDYIPEILLPTTPVNRDQLEEILKVYEK